LAATPKKGPVVVVIPVTEFEAAPSKFLSL
jgi:hypothetical protein